MSTKTPPYVKGNIPLLEDWNSFLMSPVQTTEIEDAAITAAKIGQLPACRIRHSVNQSIADNTITFPAFDTPFYNPFDMYDDVNQDRIIAPIDGLYLIMTSVVWAANATGERLVTIRINNLSTIAGSRVNAFNSSSVASNQNTVSVWPLDAGQYAQIQVRQTSGGALDLQASNPQGPSLSMLWVGPKE